LLSPKGTIQALEGAPSSFTDCVRTFSQPFATIGHLASPCAPRLSQGRSSRTSYWRRRRQPSPSRGARGTSRVARVVAIDQPTIRRLYASSTTVRESPARSEAGCLRRSPGPAAASLSCQSLTASAPDKPNPGTATNGTYDSRAAVEPNATLHVGGTSLGIAGRANFLDPPAKRGRSVPSITAPLR
jgi:hypothetical protein